jgi:hypothetical protein
MANAAGTLRATVETGDTPVNCPTGSLGLDALTMGKHGKTPLGDLGTIVCSYDETQGYTSNGLASYFHDLGHRTHINDLVRSSWLDAPTANQSLGGKCVSRG